MAIHRWKDLLEKKYTPEELAALEEEVKKAVEALKETEDLVTDGKRVQLQGV